MPRYRPDQAVQKEFLAGAFLGLLVAYGTGTTSGTGNTASLVSHGALDKDGNAFPAANLRVLAMPTATTSTVYRSASATATQIDIRSAGTSITYDWFLFVVN